jgi:hypothetical protein
MKNYKVKCRNLKESHTIQKHAFELGYGWCFSGCILMDSIYFFFNSENGDITTMGNKDSDLRYFNKHKYEEITPQEFITLKEVGGEINIGDEKNINQVKENGYVNTHTIDNWHRYSFRYECDASGMDITYELKPDKMEEGTWMKLTERFHDFLRSVGFIIPYDGIGDNDE